MNKRYPTNKEFSRFMAKVEGNVKRAAEILQCREELVYMINSGDRPISKERALLAFDAFPELSIFYLLYPERDFRDAA